MGLLRRSQSAVSVDEENPYWMSFSDIMASLLVIFILATATLILQLTHLQEELKNKRDEISQDIIDLTKAESIRQDLLREIEQELIQNNIPVEIADNDTVLRIPEQALAFASSSSEIPVEAEQVVEQIGTVIYQHIQKQQRWQYLDTIFIEGHTDSNPFRFNPRGNWDLSTSRAVSVWYYWTTKLEMGEQLKQMKNHTGHNLFSVSGYADTRLARMDCAIDDEECHKKNRRIDIRITVKKPSIIDFQAIQEKF